MKPPLAARTRHGARRDQVSEVVLDEHVVVCAPRRRDIHGERSAAVVEFHAGELSGEPGAGQMGRPATTRSKCSMQLVTARVKLP